ncbi:unnamed protein product [Arctogadus glacialis]
MLFAPWGWGGKVSLSDDVLSLCDISPGKKRLKGIFWSGERMYGLLADSPQGAVLNTHSSRVQRPFHPPPPQPRRFPPPTGRRVWVHPLQGAGRISTLNQCFFTAGRFPPAQHHPNARLKGTP